MRADVDALEISGASSIPHLSLGKFVRDQTVVFGAVDGGVVRAFEVRRNGRLWGSVGDDRAASFNLLGVGVGHYLLPNSVFVGGTLGVAWLVVSDGDRRIGETGMGPGAALQLVKDFRISDRFQLGVGLYASAGTMSERDGSARWTAHSEGLALSLSYASEAWGPRR